MESLTFAVQAEPRMKLALMGEGIDMKIGDFVMVINGYDSYCGYIGSVAFASGDGCVVKLSGGSEIWFSNVDLSLLTPQEVAHHFAEEICRD